MDRTRTSWMLLSTLSHVQFLGGKISKVFFWMSAKITHALQRRCRCWKTEKVATTYKNRYQMQYIITCANLRAQINWLAESATVKRNIHIRLNKRTWQPFQSMDPKDSAALNKASSRNRSIAWVIPRLNLCAKVTWSIFLYTFTSKATWKKISNYRQLNLTEYGVTYDCMSTLKKNCGDISNLNHIVRSDSH